MTTPAAWDAKAADFDAEPDHGLTDPAVRAAWRELLTPLLPPTPARVLDPGCGTGSLAVLLAGGGHDVTGVDFAPAMVARARAKAAAAGLTVDLRVGDAADPAVPSVSVVVPLTDPALWGRAVDDERYLVLSRC